MANWTLGILANMSELKKYFWPKKSFLPDRESNPGLPRDRRRSLPLDYRGLDSNLCQNLATAHFNADFLMSHIEQNFVRFSLHRYKLINLIN